MKTIEQCEELWGIFKEGVLCSDEKNEGKKQAWIFKTRGHAVNQMERYYEMYNLKLKRLKVCYKIKV